MIREGETLRRPGQRNRPVLAALPPGTRVYPGHRAPTTIAQELPWLRDFRFPERREALR